LPTMSVISLRGAARCFFVTESADGCIVSRRCSAMVTRETLTGAETPMSGRISTLPSMRGYGVCQHQASTLAEGKLVIQRLQASYLERKRSNENRRRVETRTSVADMPG
jgi:hypothetical protein